MNQKSPAHLLVGSLLPSNLGGLDGSNSRLRRGLMDNQSLGAMKKEMKNNKIIGLEEFRKVVAELANETENEFPKVSFNYAGIIPIKEESFRYHPSPTNTEVFAKTGGDGVRKLSDKFGFKHIPLSNQRLKELEDNYFEHLQFNPEFIEKYNKKIK